MEEHYLIFAIFSLLFLMSFVLFANLCVKLEKKKQPSSEKHGQPSKSNTTESLQKLHTVITMETGIGLQDGSIPHRHLSTTSSRYSDKRLRPFTSYTPVEMSPYSRSISSNSSGELPGKGKDLSRYRVGSESQKVRRDNPHMVAAHQRQWSMEAPRSFTSQHLRPSPPSTASKPAHLPHTQLSRDTPLRSSGGSTVVSQKWSHYQPHSSPSSSCSGTTGTLPVETPTPSNSVAESATEAGRYKPAPSKPIAPKYSDSKAKGTPVRNARIETEPRPEQSKAGTSPRREYSQAPVATAYAYRTPTYTHVSLPRVTYTDDVNTSLPANYQNPRLVKRQLSYDDPGCYPSYYRPATDSTCQLYSTQSNRNLPLRMRFPKISNGTDFPDDETEGTSVCPSIYSSYTSLYQTDTEEFMIGDPQLIKLARDLESPFISDFVASEQRTPLVAQYARHYTEDLLRSNRCPSNMSEMSDSETSFIWQGGDLGTHEYTSHDFPSNDKRAVIFPRPPNRKQGYTDYTGGLSFFSFVKKTSIPEEMQPNEPNLQPQELSSPSRFMNYPIFAKSPTYTSSQFPDNSYYNMESYSSVNHIRIPTSRHISHSNEELKPYKRQQPVNENSGSHPNLRSYKHPHYNSSDHPLQGHPSPDLPPPIYPKVGTPYNRNNSNNEMDGGSLTHL